MMPTRQERGDPELLAAAKRDPQAFKEFYERYNLMIGYWLLRRTNSEEIAADLTAETFAQAWLSRRRFKGSDDDSGAPWLFGIARNLLGTWLRKQQVEAKGRRKLGIRSQVQSEDVYEQVDERVDAESARPQICAAVAGLPAEQRAALELRALEQMPYEQVAAQLGCSENAARLRVSRALGTLREDLRAEA
jgi:RNA polymerase sigma-70 factor (ECF subfamily)